MNLKLYKMEKLELKHLVCYLPYGLRVSRYDNQFYKGYVIHNVIGLTEDFRYKKEDLDPDDSKDLLKLKQITFWLDEGYGINNIVYDVKPIFHPLSDLTKEIEVNCEKFYPYEKLHLCYSDVTNFLNDDLWIGQWWDYEKVTKLFEWHFDVFGLIEQGLAIDINTL